MAAKLTIRVDVTEPGADDERRDELAAELGEALRESTSLPFARPSAGVSAPGSRGTLETVGAVLVVVQASVEVLRVVHGAIEDWRKRRNRPPETSATVLVQIGDSRVELADVPPERQAELVQAVLDVLGEDDDRN